ncbi:MAG: hypothetical protein AAB686_03700 [Patescibacteria group bacterium]
MENFDDLGGKGTKFDFKNFKDSGVSLITRLLLRFWPSRGVGRLAREFGLSDKLMEKANGLFLNVQRIDIVPSKSGERGFQIILDKSTALYFYQDGDHFIYDGCEVGKYERGEVTIFDRLK